MTRIRKGRSEYRGSDFPNGPTDGRMIYSSITPWVHMLYTAEDDSEHVELDFTSGASARDRDDHFGVS